MINWRNSAAYKKAVDTAFAPYTDWKGDVQCFWCKHVFGKVDPCHILNVGSARAIKMEPLNIVPGCRLCHSYYDTHPKEKMDKVERDLPGRIALLRELIKERINWRR